MSIRKYTRSIRRSSLFLAFNECCDLVYLECVSRLSYASRWTTFAYNVPGGNDIFLLFDIITFSICFRFFRFLCFIWCVSRACGDHCVSHIIKKWSVLSTRLPFFVSFFFQLVLFEVLATSPARGGARQIVSSGFGFYLFFFFLFDLDSLFLSSLWLFPFVSLFHIMCMSCLSYPLR